MADRRDLQEELNRINSLFQEKDLEMRKVGASTEQRQMMRDMLNQKKERLLSEMGDDLQKINADGAINIGKGTISQGIDQTGLPDASKQVGLGKFGKTLRSLGKKAAGIIPLAGAGMAALSGDPAMAAEELAQDAMGPAGLAYEAIKPSDSGNVEEEFQDIAEDKARKAYAQSPARLDKLAKLKSLMGSK